MHEFLKQPSDCTCTVENQKFNTLCQIVNLQGDSAREKIGLWVHKVDNCEAGRENGILICGRASSTGKSTVMSALAHLVGDTDSCFQPTYGGSFPFHGWESHKVLMWMTIVCI